MSTVSLMTSLLTEVHDDTTLPMWRDLLILKNSPNFGMM